MNRVFRLGVVESLDAPYHYPCFIEPSNSTEPCKPGISGEIWTLIAQRMNWTLEFVKADAYGGYEPDEKGNFSGILGMIQNGSIDGTLSFQSLRPARYAYFKYTEVAQTYESGLIIGENIEAKSEIQVQVFEWSIVGLIVGSLLVIFIYQQFILNCLTPSSSFFHNWINVDPILLRFYRLRCSLPNAVLAIAFTLINILYFAEFRSQVMFARLQTSDERFDDFFADKSRKVIVWSAISLTQQHRTTIFGPQATQTDVLSRIVEMPSVENISKILCKNSNVAYYTDRVDMFLNTRSNANCNFKVLTGNAPSLSFKGTRAYIVSKSFSSRQLEIINDIIRKIFDVDRSKKLFPKYGIFPRNEMPAINQRFLQRISISFSQIDQGLYIGASVLLFAFFVLFFEILYSKLNEKRDSNAIHTEKPLNNEWIMHYSHHY